MIRAKWLLAWNRRSHSLPESERRAARRSRPRVLIAERRKVAIAETEEGRAGVMDREIQVAIADGPESGRSLLVA